MAMEQVQDQRLDRLEHNQEKIMEQLAGISRTVERLVTLVEQERGNHIKIARLEAEMRVVKWVGGLGGGVIVVALGALITGVIGG